jgi:predicted enzyme related to lactoylglutathione lyase
VIVRNEYPSGVPCWVDIVPPDPEAAVAFYGDVFGWQFERQGPAGSAGYVVARLEGQDVAGIGAPMEGSPDRATWWTYIAVDDADAAARRVRDAGGRVEVGPFDVPGAGRMAVCADPAGAVFNLWQAAGRAGAQLVNAPGTWNWSDLHTTDPDGARAFYGAVFGWEARTLDLGFEATMWCVPGYGDFLATIDPDIRRRHAEGGAPEGFADAIGWVATATEDTPGGGATSAWKVTFSVDDTDAVVDRVVKAGGRIVTPPYDAGVARIATVEDNQGASFTVSHYQPDADTQ